MATVMGGLRSLFLVIVALSVTVSGQYGCADGPNSGIKIGDEAWVCIVVGSTERAVFRVGVDDYTKLMIPKAHDDLPKEDNGGTYFYLQSYDKVSFRKLWRNDVPQTFSMITAIISVDDGSVTGISFDAGCQGCSDNECVDNTYSLEMDPVTAVPGKGGECRQSTEACTNVDGEDLCPLTVYVVWSGTDADSKYMHSQNQRFSRFSDDAVKDYLDKGSKEITWTPPPPL